MSPREHACVEDRIARGGFDRSIVDFSERYADQNERDYEAFVGAVRSGRLEVVEGV